MEWRKAKRNAVDPSNSPQIPMLILIQDKQADRAVMWSKLIHVAELLRNMNNYHTLMALVAGLNNASIQRLKNTRATVPPKLLNVWSSRDWITFHSIPFHSILRHSTPLHSNLFHCIALH